MADQRITQLNELSKAGVSANDVLPIVHLSETRKVTAKNLVAAGIDLVDNGEIDLAKLDQSSVTKLGSTALADDAVTAAKLANDSSVAVQTVTPTSDNFEGRGYFNSSTGNLQVFNGSAYQQVVMPESGIGDLQITNGKLANGAVTTAKIDALGLGTAALADDAVTYDKLQNTTSSNVLLGRSTAGAGNVEEISCTAAGRALLDDADAATQRTTLGLGTLATQNSASVTITGGTISGLTSISSTTSSLGSATITGGTISGITDLAVADGGTGASDATTARANLGLAIGSNVQAYDAALQSIAELTTNADVTLYATGSNTYATTGLTAFGRSLIDDTDAASARTTLGLGTLATQNGTFSGTHSGTTSGTNTGDQTITLTGDVTGSGTGTFAATIANGAVTEAKLATDAVSSSKIAAGAVTASKIAADSITAAQIAPAAIGASELADDAVDTNAVQALAITEAKLAAGAVTNAKLGDLAVTNAKIADTTISYGKLNLADGSVPGAKIAADSITNTQIAADAVSSVELATDAVSTIKIAAGAVTSAKLAAGAVDATALGTGAVVNAKLGTGAVTYDKIQNVSATDRLLGRSSAGAGSIEEIPLTAAGRALLDDADAAAQRNTLGLGSLATQSGTFSGTFSGTSSGTNTGDQTITLTGDVTGSGTGAFAATVSSGAITEAKLATDAVSTNKIVNDAVIAAKLADNSAAIVAAAVPSGTGAFIGQQWINTATAIEYTWDGTEWLRQASLSTLAFVDTTPLNFSVVYPDPYSAEITAALDNQTANRVFAGPSAGSAAAPTFRALVPADLPDATSTTKGVIVPGSGLSISSGTLNHSNTVTAGTATKITFDAQGHVTAGASLLASDIPNLDASKITTGTFGASSLANDSVTAVKLSDYSTAQIGSTLPTADFIGQFFLNPLERTVYMWDGNVWQPVGITAGTVIFAGTYDANTNQIASVTADGAALGLSIGNPLPAASSTNQNYFVIVSNAGTGTSPAPAVAMLPPDLILSTGSSWVRIESSDAYIAQVATQVSFTPAGQIASTNVQAAIEEVSSECRNATNITSGTLATTVGGTGLTSYVKGDLIAGSGTNVLSKLAVGTNGFILRANSATATGLEWATYDALVTSGGTMTGNIALSSTAALVFEGSTEDVYETTLTAIDPTADHTVSLPNATGTLALTSDLDDGTY